MSNNWFEIDNTGWKRMNAGRPSYELVKELIQNVMDEEFNVTNIDFYFSNGIFHLSIEDDVVGGIKDISLITTVFMTGKEDSHLKRGRKGRGLKEFLSVCNTATVETVGNTIEFKSDGTRSDYPNSRTSGTKIDCKIISEGWTKKSVNEINNFLNKIIIYNNSTININGKVLERRDILNNIYHVELKTHVVENGIQLEVYKYTDIDIYAKKDKKGWIYEMGIPVVMTDIPYDIDIKQRIPLNDNRNDINSYYIEEVKSYVVKTLLNSMTKSDLLGWGSGGLKRIYNFTFSECQKITEIMIGDVIDFKSTVIKSDRKMDDKARQKGYTIFDISSIDYSLRSIIESTLITSSVLIKRIEETCKPIIVEETKLEREFCEAHRKLVKNALSLDIIVNFIEKEKDLVSGTMTLAFYEKGNEFGSKSKLSYNRLAISEKVISNPLCSKALDILFHELGHERYSEHSFEFIDAVTSYASKIAVYLIGSNKEVKKTSSITVKDEIKSILELQGYNYITLNDLYSCMNAVTSNQKAGIRGVINRECGNIFERHIEGGKYRLKCI